MNKKWVIVILVVILLVAAFMRLYRISDYMTFLGDEGRDVLVVKGILDGNLTLLGPRASAGDFYTGPIYYYMMAPFLALFQLDPVGPAVMVALFGVATVFLIFWVGRTFFNYKAGLIAAALYAVSPLVLVYSRSSWNPNTVPFFALLTIFMLYKAVTTANAPWRYYIFTGFLLGISVQLHYISLFLAVAVAISLLIMNWYLNGKPKILQLIRYYLEILAGFIIGISPFLLFEVRHDFLNFKAIFAFITQDTVKQAYETYSAFYQPIADVFFRLFARLVFNFPTPDQYYLHPLLNLQLFGLVIMLLAVASIVILFKNKNKFATILLLVWLTTGVVFFGLYKKPIYDYYMVFMFPLSFLLIGNVLSRITELKRGKFTYGVIPAAILFIAIFSYNLYGMPFKSEPNRQKDQVKQISSYVISKTDSKPYNFALISNANSDHAYRYYLEVLGAKPVGIDNPIADPNRKSVTDQLMIVCENTSCQPLGNSLFEVAGFGRASISGEWDVSVVKVFRLVHYTGTDTQSGK